MALDTDLRAYWKMDESSGNPVDATGNGYTLTNNNTVSFGTGALNNTSDAGSSNSSKNFSIAGSGGTTLGMSNSLGNFSVNWWVNINTLPASNTAGFFWKYAVASGATNTGQIDCQYYNNAGTPQIYISRNCNGTLDQSTGYNKTLTVGTWFMYTLTYDGATLRLYENGNSTPVLTKASTTTGTGGSYANRFTIFSSFDSTPTDNTFLSAKTDEIGVWNQTLSTTDISTLYNSGTPYPYSSFGGGGGGGGGTNYLMLMGAG